MSNILTSFLVDVVCLFVLFLNIERPVLACTATKNYGRLCDQLEHSV